MEKLKSILTSKEMETAVWHALDLALTGVIIYLTGINTEWALAILPLLTYTSKIVNTTYIK